MNAQEGIKFDENLTWKQVLQKAKDENKYIFVDCYATWCGPCKWMDKSVYSLEKVGNYYNDKYISLRVQMDSSKLDNDFVKGWYVEASMIKSKYKVAAFPTYLFFTPNGDIVHRDVGAKAPDEFMAVGADALNSDKQYYTALEKYRRNKLDTAYMKRLARKAKTLGGEELARKIANDYINRVQIDVLFTQDNIWFMTEFTNSSKDRGFVMFRDSSKRISEADKLVTASYCKNIVLGIINVEEIKPYSSVKSGKPDWERIKLNLKKYGEVGEEALIKYKPGIIFKTEIEPTLKINSDWNTILPLIEKQKLGRNAEFVVGCTVVYYLNTVGFYHTEDNCKNLVAAASYYADSFSTFLNANALNTWAWTLFENSNDKGELRKALEWSKRSNELKPASPDFVDTYANILYKLGLVEEALVWQGKAVQIEEGKYKRPVFKQTLEKMQKGEKTWP
jgi:thiol-disulfide isomerase/thioredoxin